MSFWRTSAWRFLKTRLVLIKYICRVCYWFDDLLNMLYTDIKSLINTMIPKVWDLIMWYTHLLKEPCHLTHETLLWLWRHHTYVFVRQEIVSQQGRMGKSLNDAVHETCVAKVNQSTQTCTKQTSDVYRDDSYIICLLYVVQYIMLPCKVTN